MHPHDGTSPQVIADANTQPPDFSVHHCQALAWTQICGLLERNFAWDVYIKQVGLPVQVGSGLWRVEFEDG